MILVSAFLQNIELDHQIWGMDRFTKQQMESARIEQLTGQYSFFPSRGRTLFESTWSPTRSYLQAEVWRILAVCIWLYLPPPATETTSKVKGFPVSKTQKPAGNDHFGPIMEENSKPLAVHVIEGVDIVQ